MFAREIRTRELLQVRGRGGGFVVVLLLLQPQWASQWESCCGYGWAGWCIPAQESSLPFGVGFKSDCLPRDPRVFHCCTANQSALSRVLWGYCQGKAIRLGIPRLRSCFSPFPCPCPLAPDSVGNEWLRQAGTLGKLESLLWLCRAAWGSASCI